MGVQDGMSRTILLGSCTGARTLLNLWGANWHVADCCCKPGCTTIELALAGRLHRRK